jgi:hypothetical protein
MKLKSLLLAAAALLVSTTAEAQPNVIRMQLDSAVVLMRGQGFTPLDDAVTGSLAAGQDEEFEVELEAGVTYMVVGVCDGGCSDLDLVLSDDDGEEMEADRELDDVPMLAVEVTSNVEAVLKVQMATCSTAQCQYGVRVFRNRGK